ncbi:MAG: hypothetical protein R2710_22595 [Acidimicrobiales bacterium]
MVQPFRAGCALMGVACMTLRFRPVPALPTDPFEVGDPLSIDGGASLTASMDWIDQAHADLV